MDGSQGLSECNERNPWVNVSETKDRTQRGASNPGHPFSVRDPGRSSYQGYAKNAYPWLSSLHRSAVILHQKSNCTPILANRAGMMVSGVSQGWVALPNVCWYVSATLELNRL